MKNSIVITTFAILFVGHVSLAQDPIQLTPTVIPPAPSAAELGRYGLIPVGLSTGTMNPEVQLYQFRTKSLTLPISVTYNGSAIRVDEVSSWVGMHWSLNAGGVITRVVRDDPDETTYFDSEYPGNFDSQNPEAIAFIEQAANSQKDTEPDLYSYNFAGYAGKFVFDRNGEIVSMPCNDLIIQKLKGSSTSAFMVTTFEGVRYTFEAAESTVMQVSYDATFPTAISSWFLTRIEHPLGDVITLTYASSTYSYLLGVSQTYTRNAARNSCIQGGSENSQTIYCDPGGSSLTTSSMLVHGQRVVKIESSGYGSIDFSSSNNRSDLNDYRLDEISIKNPSANIIKSISFGYQFSNNPNFINAVNSSYSDLQHRMFLTSVVEKDKNGVSVKKHRFDYIDIDALPARLAYAQDHWGYFNGVNNYDFLPTNREERDYTGGLAFANVGGDREPNSEFAMKGLLSRITYPTGGYSEFQYGPNTYWGQRTIYPPSLLVNVLCDAHESPLPVIKTQQIHSSIAQSVQMHAVANLLPAYTSTQSVSRVEVYDQNGVSIAGQDLILDTPTTFIVDLAANQNYTIKLTALTVGDDQNNTFSQVYFNYIGTATQVVNDNLETGGLRVNVVTNYDPVTQKKEIVNYHYAKHDNLQQSSGLRAPLPQYVTKYVMKSHCGGDCAYLSCPYVALHSSNVSNQFLSTNSVYYQYVTITRGADYGAGLEEHEFTISFDNSGTQVWGDDYIKDSPLSNTGWDNNREKNVNYYSYKNNQAILVRNVANSWVKDDRYHIEVKGLSTRKKYEPICRQDAVIQCDASNINKFWTHWDCVTNHKHVWLLLGPIFPDSEGDGVTCIAKGAQMQHVVYMWHPCYGKTVGSTAIVPYALDYVDALEYSNISDWICLAKTTETVYDEDGVNALSSETQYFYDNVTYKLLTRKLSTNSEEKPRETSIKYAFDYTPASDPSVAAMLDKRMFAFPLKTETTLDGYQIGGDISKRDVNGQIVNVYKYESTTLQSLTQHDQTTIVPPAGYNLKSTIQFDPQSKNPVGAQLNNNINTVYVWGYGGTLPIAEVKNADYGATPVDVSTSQAWSAEISSVVAAASLGASLEIFTNQSMGVSVTLTPYGSAAPADPEVTIRLEKSDGTIVGSYDLAWGANTLSPIAVTTGSYRWSYYVGDLEYTSQFSGLNLSGSLTYTGRRPPLKAVYTSFEDDGVADAAARTGRKVWSGQYTVSLPPFTGSYELSYWEKTGSGQWTLMQQRVSVTSSTQQIIIGQAGSVIDEVRVYPVGAQMSTYTYEQLVGITSMTDPNNRTTYFKYDDFGRLSSISDEHGNLLKSYTYHYKGQ